MCDSGVGVRDLGWVQTWGVVIRGGGSSSHEGVSIDDCRGFTGFSFGSVIFFCHGDHSSSKFMDACSSGEGSRPEEN